MRNNLTDILASCLDSMERGERTVEECLALYPEYRQDLESLLSTAASVRERADYAPRPGFRQASRRRLVERLASRQPGVVRQSGWHTVPGTKRFAFLWTAIFVLVISLLGGGTVYASNEALPGDALYPVKLSIEDARLWISDDAGDVLLAAGFAQSRVEEIQSLIESGREEDLSLAAELFSERVAVVTRALAAVARENPEHAEQLSSSVEQALSIHTQVLAARLQTVPDQAKPALERAILASSTGQEVVESLFEDESPSGGPPEELPGPPATQPGGGPPEGVPQPAATQPGGGPPEEKPGPPATQPGGGPPEGVPGPPTDRPGGRPDNLPNPRPGSRP